MGSSRAETFLVKAGLRSPESLSLLERDTGPGFQDLALDPKSEHRRATQRLLIQQRTSDPGYRSPEVQKRHLFRTKKQKEACHEENWVFSKHEIARAFDSLLSQTPEAQTELLWATVVDVPPLSLQELWCHLHDARLEKRQKRPWHPGLVVETSSSLSGFSWLDKATQQGHLNHMTFLCRARLDQAVLDRALGIALEARSVERIRLLLSFGAAASGHREKVSTYVRTGSIALLKLLLSAPESMDTASWQYCLEPALSSPEPAREDLANILVYCCRYRPGIISENLFRGALRLPDLGVAALMLASTESHHFSSSTAEAACREGADIDDYECRLAFFSLLGEANMIRDDATCRRELAGAAEAGHTELVELLVTAGVAVEVPFYEAVARLDFDMLDLLRKGCFISRISDALPSIPTNVSMPALLRLVNILGPLGFTGAILDPYLPVATAAKSRELIDSLIQYGASVEHDSAAAIRIAITGGDFDYLTVLLQQDCSPAILSAAVPTAMALPSWSSRLQVMKSLLDKGIEPQSLDRDWLLPLLSDDRTVVDAELIHLLAQQLGDKRLLVRDVIHTGNEDMLHSLCQAELSDQDLATGVSIAVDEALASLSLPYETLLNMVRLLLQKGASGALIDDALRRAALNDIRLDIVQLLLLHGADANYSAGAAYLTAVQRRNIFLLDLLLGACTPNHENLEVLFFAIMSLHPDHYFEQFVDRILAYIASYSDWIDLKWDISDITSHHNFSTIAMHLMRHPFFLRTWVSLDAFLVAAIRASDPKLAAAILTHDLSRETLRAAFKEAHRAESRTLQLVFMRLLLDKASRQHGDCEIGQSEILPKETLLALEEGDYSGLILLLHYCASADFNTGEALRIASTRGSLPVVNLLVVRAAPSTIEHALEETLQAVLKPAERYGILSRLLKANPAVSPGWTSSALHHVCRVEPDHTRLIHLLLAHGAKPTWVCLVEAWRLCPEEVFVVLTAEATPSTVDLAFAPAPDKDEIDATRRYWGYRTLLARGVDPQLISQALIATLSNQPLDWEILTLLLEHGAEVGYQEGEPFRLALLIGDFYVFRLLCQYIKDESTANLAFRSVSRENTVSPEQLHQAYTQLAVWPISQTNLDMALVCAVGGCDGKRNMVIDFLLCSGADPNSDGAWCFEHAYIVTVNVYYSDFDAGVLDTLLPFADPAVVLPIFVECSNYQEDAAFWIDQCLLQTSPDFYRLRRWAKKNHLLHKCMQKFRECTTLLGLLLDHGVCSLDNFSGHLRPGWPRESCSPLLWALFSRPWVGEKTIEFILRRDPASVNYSAPKTGISPIFCCLLEKSSTSLLELVLDYGGPGVLEDTISGSMFIKLALDPALPESTSTHQYSALFGETDEISPVEASLFLGNLDAYRCLKGGSTPDDGSLHLAALLALPDFVSFLIDERGHDPNHEAESLGFMVPLGVACLSRRFPWCRASDDEVAWRRRLDETMRLLAVETDHSWRLGQKTLLHIALENGADVTEAMVSALSIAEDPERSTKYLYRDRAGKWFTPEEYADSLEAASPDEKARVMTCLQRCFDLLVRVQASDAGAMPGPRRTRVHVYRPEALESEYP